MPTHKLSKTQIELLRLMNNGWELGSSMTLNDGCYIQQDGIGKGGKSQSVNSNTLDSLYYHKCITINFESFPSRHYKLTEKGKQYAES